MVAGGVLAVSERGETVATRGDNNGGGEKKKHRKEQCASRERDIICLTWAFSGLGILSFLSPNFLTKAQYRINTYNCFNYFAISIKLIIL